MIKINMTLHGAFHQYSKENIINFNIPKGSSIQKIKESLILALTNANAVSELKDLVDCSAVVGNDKILTEIDILYQDSSLAILPPVCGG